MTSSGGRRAAYRTSGGGARHPYSRLPSHGGGPHGHGSGAYIRIPRDAVRKVLVATLVVLPWSVLLLLAAAHSWRGGRHAAMPAAHLPGAKQCVGWRETYFCHPFA